jgi:hypothetical protein
MESSSLMPAQKPEGSQHATGSGRVGGKGREAGSEKDIAEKMRWHPNSRPANAVKDVSGPRADDAKLPDSLRNQRRDPTETQGLPTGYPPEHLQSPWLSPGLRHACPWFSLLRSSRRRNAILRSRLARLLASDHCPSRLDRLNRARSSAISITRNTSAPPSKARSQMTIPRKSIGRECVPPRPALIGRPFEGRDRSGPCRNCRPAPYCVERVA